MQSSFDFTGEQLKEAGIQLAAEHAEQVDPGWNKKAFKMLLEFMNIRLGPFMIEDFRQWAEPSGLPQPPSLRAYGGIAQKAAKLGLMRKVGTHKVTNAKAHQAYASIWQSNKS